MLKIIGTIYSSGLNLEMLLKMEVNCILSLFMLLLIFSSIISSISKYSAYIIIFLLS